MGAISFFIFFFTILVLARQVSHPAQWLHPGKSFLRHKELESPHLGLGFLHYGLSHSCLQGRTQVVGSIESSRQACLLPSWSFTPQRNLPCPLSSHPIPIWESVPRLQGLQTLIWILLQEQSLTKDNCPPHLFSKLEGAKAGRGEMHPPCTHTPVMTFHRMSTTAAWTSCGRRS